MRLVPSDKGRGLYDWLLPELRALYARIGRRVTRHELMLEIEKRWGDKIVEKVCIPKGMSKGECLSLAAWEAANPVPR